MPANNDPQREAELNLQRGYGEVPNTDKSVQEQETHQAGYKRGKKDAGNDGDGLVKTFEDERAPNVPDTVDSDKGPAKSKA